MQNVRNVFNDGVERVRNANLWERSGLKNRSIRCGSYGPLGWMETLIKMVAIVVAFTSIGEFTTELGDVEYSWIRVAIIWQIGIQMVIHFLWWIVKVLDREIHAIVMGFLHTLALVVLFVIEFTSVDPGVYILTFCFLNLMSDYMHLMFLFVADSYSPLWIKKPLIYALTIFFIILNFTTNILQLEYWYDFND